jgi:hypothetical protein
LRYASIDWIVLEVPNQVRVSESSLIDMFTRDM